MRKAILLMILAVVSSNAAAALGIESGGRLVEKKDAWIAY